jgi:hypothetical protein
MAAGDLCSLEDVRTFQRTANSHREDDEVIEPLITRASSVISGFCGLDFAAGTGTRDLVYDGHGELLLRPYLARSVTAVVLDVDLPEAEQTALEVGGWKLRPRPSLDGAYRSLLLPGCVTRREHEVAVTGAWGFEDMPESLVHACVVTVVEWIRGGVDAFSRSFELEAGRLNRPEELPSAVKATLRAAGYAPPTL